MATWASVVADVVGRWPGQASRASQAGHHLRRRTQPVDPAAQPERLQVRGCTSRDQKRLPTQATNDQKFCTGRLMNNQEIQMIRWHKN